MKHLFLLPFFAFAVCHAQKTDSAPSADPSSKAASNPATINVLMKTNHGDVTIELNNKKAPITTQNFLKYVDAKFYDKTIFHRIMDGFMIQGGGFKLKDGIPTEEKTNPPIKNEGQNGLKNLTGTIAMARTSDLNSATSQFFINVVDNKGLDFPSNGGYAVFGKVTKGMDVVNKIKKAKTGAKYMNSRSPKGKLSPAPHQNVPLEPVVIYSIRRVQ